MDFIKILIIMNLFQKKFVDAQTENSISNPKRVLENNVKLFINELQRDMDKVLDENIIVEDSYDYDDFISEYFSNNTTLKLNIANRGLQKGKLSNNVVDNMHNEGISSNNNSERSIKSSRFSKDVENKQSPEFGLRHLLEILKIFVVVYSILAIPLWCTKGWCCCCLPCKFFKPNKIIEEAKTFLECNPPGVFKHRDRVIYYEPTDNERDCYEKLEYIIRTI